MKKIFVAIILITIGVAAIILTVAVLRPPFIEMPSGEIPEFGFEYTQNIESSLGDGYSFKVQDAKIDSTGGKQYVIRELYQNTPVFGGSIILGMNKDDSVMVVEDNTTDIKEPQNKPWPKRTIKGEELHRVLKEQIGVRDEEMQNYNAEMVIASKTEDGSPSDTSYGWRITGPGVDRVVELETGRNLYRIERSTVAPPTKLLHREIREPRFLSIVRGVYIRFREWFTNLFRQIKRRT